MTTKDTQTPHSAEVTTDPALKTTVISLFYRDKADEKRNIVISIAPDLGSNMFRFRVGKHDVIYCDQSTLLQRGFTGNFVLWPLPNRIRDQHYTYQEKSYSLTDIARVQGDPVLIHGLVFDQVWQYEEPVIGPESASVTTYIDINEQSPHYAGYPFDSRFSLTYTLTKDGVEITYRVQNRGEEMLPFGFALHPYFSTLSGREQTRVTLPADRLMEADRALLPTGKVLELNGIMYAMYDLRSPTPIDHLKLDHVYTQLHQGEPAVIEYPEQGMRLAISGSEDFTHVVIYVPVQEPFFCLEHQTCSTDAVNLHNQGPELRELAHLLEVAPGESSSGSLHYTIQPL